MGARRGVLGFCLIEMRLPLEATCKQNEEAWRGKERGRQCEGRTRPGSPGEWSALAMCREVSCPFVQGHVWFPVRPWCCSPSGSWVLCRLGLTGMNFPLCSAILRGFVFCYLSGCESPSVNSDAGRFSFLLSINQTNFSLEPLST